MGQWPQSYAYMYIIIYLFNYVYIYITIYIYMYVYICVLYVIYWYDIYIQYTQIYTLYIPATYTWDTLSLVWDYPRAASGVKASLLCCVQEQIKKTPGHGAMELGDIAVSLKRWVTVYISNHSCITVYQ